METATIIRIYISDKTCQVCHFNESDGTIKDFLDANHIEVPSIMVGVPNLQQLLKTRTCRGCRNIGRQETVKEYIYRQYSCYLYWYYLSEVMNLIKWMPPSKCLPQGSAMYRQTLESSISQFREGQEDKTEDVKKTLAL